MQPARFLRLFAFPPRLTNLLPCFASCCWPVDGLALGACEGLGVLSPVSEKGSPTAASPSGRVQVDFHNLSCFSAPENTNRSFLLCPE